MLTTIGDQIIEIRPKQIIESSELLSCDYLVPYIEKKPKAKGVKKNAELQKRPHANSKTKA